MEFPTSTPNEIARNLIHPNRRDNNWGRAVNDNLYELASKGDEYRDTVRSDVIELERRVAAQFQSLVDLINGNVADYGFQMGATRKHIMDTVKLYLQNKMTVVVNELVVTTKGSLEAINEMEETLLLQINKIQTEFNLFEGQIISETDRTLALVDSETRETNSVKDEIVQSVKDIRNKLVSHVTDKNNPHEDASDKMADNNVFYQPDPTGADAIQPHNEFDVLSINKPTDSELEELEGTNVVPIGEIDSGTLSVLWQNLLSKYIVFEGLALNSPGTYFRLGGAAGYAQNGIATENAIDPTGDLLIIDNSTGDPNELRLTWDVSAKNHQPGDFIVLDFGNTNPSEDSSVTISFYPEGGVLASPASVVTETLSRLRLLNTPQIVNKIFSYEAVSEIDGSLEVNIEAANLAFYGESTTNLTAIPILGWTPDFSLGFNVWRLNLTIGSNVEKPRVPLFPIPRVILDQLKAFTGFETLTTWPIGYFNGIIGNRKFMGYADPSNVNRYILITKPEETGDYYKLIIAVANNLTPIVHDEILTVVKEFYNQSTSSILKTVTGTVKTYEPGYTPSSSS